MTEEKWKTVSKLLIVDGYKSTVEYVNNLVLENIKLRAMVSKTMRELLDENERLYKRIIEISKKDQSK